MMNYLPDPARYDGRMPYKRCGKSGLLLPAISLGLWHNFGDTDRFDVCQDMIRNAFDHGVTHFDLANNYGPAYGAAEETFGRILQKNPFVRREEIVVSTKAGHEMWQGPYGNGGSRKMLMTSLDQSLRRMQLDYVDIFYSHRFDPDTPLEETLQALVDIVRSGKALYAGISKYPAPEARFAYNYLREHDVPCLIYQGRYNLFNREPENEVIAEAAANGAGFIAFSPLAQGLLTNRYLNGVPSDSRIARPEGYLKAEQLSVETLAKIQALHKIAENRGQTLAEMSLAWLLQHPMVTSVIVGASSTAQLKTNLQATSSAPFTSDELDAIEKICKS